MEPLQAHGSPLGPGTLGHLGGSRFPREGPPAELTLPWGPEQPQQGPGAAGPGEGSRATWAQVPAPSRPDGRDVARRGSRRVPAPRHLSRGAPLCPLLAEGAGPVPVFAGPRASRPRSGSQAPTGVPLPLFLGNQAFGRVAGSVGPR